MTGFNAIMHQITALPQTTYTDIRGLLLRAGMGKERGRRWKGRGREGGKGKGREWGRKGGGCPSFP